MPRPLALRWIVRTLSGMARSDATRAGGAPPRRSSRIAPLLAAAGVAFASAWGPALPASAQAAPQHHAHAEPRGPSPEIRVPIPDGARLVVETERFRVVATPQAEGLARAFADELEPLRDRIAADLGQDYDGITEVRFADRASTFQVLQPVERGAPSWAVGVAWPGHNLVVINGGGGRGPAEIRRTLAHEVSHISLGRLAPRQFPRWFLEGMATYHAGEWSFARAGTLAGAVVRDDLIPLHELTRGWPDSPADVHLAYAQSIDFVSWLFRKHGRESIHRLVQEVTRGVPFEEAMEIATGTPFWKLEYEWRSTLSVRYTWVPAITSGGFLWGLTSLLFLMAYMRKRRQKHARMAAMDAEHPWDREPPEPGPEPDPDEVAAAFREEGDGRPDEDPRSADGRHQANGASRGPGADPPW